MIELTPQRRRELRAQAHALHPVVSIGQHGLTPKVLHEIDIALGAHGLVKVRVFSEDRGQRETMLAQIAGELGAAPVQHLGKVLILWRPPEEAPVKPAPRPTAKPRRERGAAGAKGPTSGNRATREPRASHVARRRTSGSGSTAGARTGTSSRSRQDSTAQQRPPRNADDAQAAEARRRRRVPGVPASAAGKRPRESAFGEKAPAPRARSRAASSPATDRPPTGKSAPSPRRRRRAV